MEAVRALIEPLNDDKPFVLVVDSHRLCRQTLASAISGTIDDLVVRTAPPDPAVILPILDQGRAGGVVLLSCCGDAMHPLPLILLIRSRHPSVRLVALSSSSGGALEAAARYTEIDAVLQSSAEVATVVHAIAVAAPKSRQTAAHWWRARPLTPREAQIVQHVATGLRNAQIANTIGISEKTVKVNLTNIYGKLGIRCRAELTALAPQLLSRPSEPAARVA